MSQQDGRLAISVKNQCNHIQIIDEMNVYKLPLKSAPSYSSGAPSIVKRFSFGEPNQRIKRENKTILLMGATGSGKTTMINAMTNFILGVEWEDNFRFMIVDEEVKGASQAHSQTQGVTAYDLHYQNGFRIPFSLTIVDTPGFGDTGGIARDKEITSAIQQLFEHQNGIQVFNDIPLPST
jgi:predicted GTPase